MKHDRGIGTWARYLVVLFMAVVVGGGPAWANCDHGSHAFSGAQGPVLSTDDHCPLCDRAMPDVIMPVMADVPPSITRYVPSATISVAEAIEGEALLPSGRGPPRMS